VGLVTSKRSRKSRTRSSAGKEKFCSSGAEQIWRRKIGTGAFCRFTILLSRESRKTPVQGNASSPSSSIICILRCKNNDVKITPRILDQAANKSRLFCVPSLADWNFKLLMSEISSAVRPSIRKKGPGGRARRKTGSRAETLTAEEH